jgi:DNA-binding MarR family transcriptional regulator
MGRYRELIRMIMKYNNLFSRRLSEKAFDGFGISLTAQQWQTLECIIEYEDTNFNMAYFAKQLGLPKSSFSKHVQSLVECDLVERYQHENNRKNVVLKPSEKGRALYKKNSTIILESGWKAVFAIMEDVPDDGLELMVKFMGAMAAELEPENNKVFALMKMP